jgi:hypothetical protein
MKKLIYLVTLILIVTSFAGCYYPRRTVYEPVPRRVIIVRERPTYGYHSFVHSRRVGRHRDRY